MEGRGQITIRDLVKNALRMRPDRIIVGEVRSGEALDMLQAMNTGHDGSLTTTHANSPRDALSRIETMVLMSGMELPKAMMITIPEPWESDDNISREKKDFYRYYATMMEPWDGPAAVLFSDGDLVGATLDRNGLRPSRYYVLEDDTVILASEVGVLDIPPEKIVQKSRLEPGKMLVVDMVRGAIISDEELKSTYAHQQPYGEWLDKNVVELSELKVPNHKVETHPQELRDKLYKAFGYTYEDLKTAILPMARDGNEQTASMGIDIPIAVLSDKHQPLFESGAEYFR